MVARACVALMLYTQALSTVLATVEIKCPANTSPIDDFKINGTAWHACEDLQVPDGGLVLVSADGHQQWFQKSYSMYGSSNDEVFDCIAASQTQWNALVGLQVLSWSWQAERDHLQDGFAGNAYAIAL